MITKFNKFNDKLFELFEQTNIYDFELFKINNKMYKKNNWSYKEYVYRFKDKAGDFYYVRLSFFNNNTKTEKNFLSIDFMEEESYQIHKNAEFDINIDYKKLNKNDAVKIINTVFKIVSDFVSIKKPWIVCFVSNDERYKTYEYIINKILNKFILISYYNDNDSQYHYYLYNGLYYYVSENGFDIVRKDNDFVVYSTNTENNNPDEFTETSE